MGDIAIVWNPATSSGDWAMSNGDLQSGSDLQSAILVSLFTDAYAPDFVPPPPSGPPNPRGCWTDTYTGFQIGSLLWTRTRLIKTQGALLLIQGDCQNALAWMVTIGVVASFDVEANFVNRTALALAITAHMPDGTTQTFNYQRFWNEI